VQQVDDFDSFYRASRSRLLGFVYALTGDVAEAQDAVQEAFVRAWQRWSTVSEHADPEAWVRLGPDMLHVEAMPTRARRHRP
jgi:DNA-directed RNA polymerase specialized sigma24 family protein